MHAGDLLFDLHVEHLDGQAVIGLCGELDVCTVLHLRRPLREMVDQTHGRVVLDLSELTFMDSSGINEIVLAHKRACELGGQVVLRSPRRSVFRALDICGITRVLPVELAS